MSYNALEDKLGLQHGSIAPILNIGVERHYTRHSIMGARHFLRRYKAPKVRNILIPRDDLKLIQKRLCRLISGRFEPHSIAHAYTRNRGIITNAKRHLGCRSILHIDLVSFFRCITEVSITKSLYGLLGNLSHKEIELIAQLCCYDGFLPQGSPASPILSNLICYSMDVQLEQMAQSSGCVVTRYSDDISFSTRAAKIPRELALVSRHNTGYQIDTGQPLRALIGRHGFEINSKKLKFQTRPGRLQVTGLIVNGEIDVPREFWRNVRAALHRWETCGLDATVYRHQPKGSKNAFIRSLKGSIDYVGQVTGRDNPRYRRFLTSFEMLLERERA